MFLFEHKYACDVSDGTTILPCPTCLSLQRHCTAIPPRPTRLHLSSELQVGDSRGTAFRLAGICATFVFVPSCLGYAGGVEP